MLKKVIACLLFSCCFLLFAQQEYLGCIRNGEYAYFLDYRHETPYAHGYLVAHPDENTSYIFCNTVEINSGKRWSFYFVTALDDKGIYIKDLGGLKNVEEDKRDMVMQTAVDFLNYAAMRKNSSDSITENCILEDPWSDDFSQWYYFSTAVPFLGFTRITDKKDAENSLIEAYCFGCLTSLEKEAIDAFYDKEIILSKEAEHDFDYVLPKAKKMTVNLNGYKIPLDENWKGNLFEENESYWLSLKSVRDAQIMVERCPENISIATNEDKLAFVRVVISAQQGIVPLSIKAQFDKKDLLVEYYIYDENRYLTYTRLRLKDDCLINFSCFKDIYEKNSKYFENILKNIRK